MFNYSDTNKIGMGLVLVGSVSYVMSMLFLFDRLLAMLGNLCFLIGLYCLVGFSGTLGFFTKRGKVRGSAFYFLGFLIIVFGWPIIGIPVQLYGLFGMFRSFIPYLLDWSMSLPGVGSSLSALIRKQQVVPAGLRRVRRPPQAEDLINCPRGHFAKLALPSEEGVSLFGHVF